MRILVADDDFTSRTLVTEVLRKEGYDIVTVADGAQANAALQADDAPQIAILDWLMPRMDGIEIVRQTRARPTDNPPYLIMLTSKTRRDDMLAGFAAGANDYLLKPFDLGELLARVAAGRRMVEMQTILNDRLAAQHFQSQFHQMAAQISARLTAVLDQAGFDQAVNTALRQLGELLDTDRSYLFRFTPDLAHMSNSHEWVAPAVASQIGRNQNLNADGLRWWKTLMLSKEPVQIPDTAALPPEASAERAMFLEQEIRSLLCLPTIGGDGQLTGFIGFDRVTHAYEWSPEQMAMLQPIADAIGATIERLRAKEALDESEIRYHSLFETARDAILITDDHQRYMEVNQAACDLLGYSRAEFLALTVPDVMVDVAETHKSWQTFIADGGQEGEATLRGKDGRLVPVEYRAVANFTPGRHFSVMRDLTERKKMEQALRDSESRLSSYIEHAPYGLFIADEHGRYVEVNPAACAVTGYDEAELLAMQVGDLLLPADYAAARDHFEQVQKTGFAVGEFAFQRKSGEMRYWLVSAVKLLPKRIMAFTQDITKRKLAERETQKYKTVLDNALHGAAIARLDGVLLYVNDYFARVHGYAPEELLGRHLAIFHDESHMPAVQETLRQMMTLGYSPTTEVPHMHKNGSEFPMLMSGVLIKGEGDEEDYMAATAVDISDRKEGEERLRQSHAELAETLQTLQEAQAQLVQQERLAAVGQLAAGIAHDFNNILAVILLYAQMMARASQLPPWETEAVAIIEKQTKTAAQLVQQILDFSRRSMMEKRTLDWLSLLKEQVRLLRHTLPDNITVILQTGSDGPFMVHADAARLQQMFLNLAINARDAMPDGGELRLELDKLDLAAEQDGLLAGSWLRLRVSDTGQGITPEDGRRIFEPFFTTKAPGKGSGLGLSQAQGIVLQHDGRIELSTVVGQGTTFTVYLPAVAGEAELSTAPVATHSGQRETVLLVEDNDSVREALVASLQMLNYEVTAVGHGREALDYLQANPGQVDAILSDMIMPVMGGAELFQQVQRLARPVPMVIITGHQMDAELNELLNQGLRGWQMKPVRFNGLAHLLEQALR